MSFTTSKESYNKAFRLYDKLNDLWYKLESGKGENVEFELHQLAEYVDKFKKLVNKIDISELALKVSSEQLEQVKHNKELFQQAIFMIGRHVDSIKYADDLKNTMLSYIVKLNLPKHEYDNYAPDEKTLAKKIIGAATHPDNIDDFKLKLNRIANNTMSIKEFKSIFYVLLKHIIQEKIETEEQEGSFQGLNDYRSQLHRSFPETEEDWRKRTGKVKEKPSYGFRIKK